MISVPAMNSNLRSCFEMKKLSLLTFFLAAVAFTDVAHSQELPFTGGESLEYVITYKALFTADMVRVSLDLTSEKDPQRGDAFHAVTKITTFKFWDSFYKMRDTYETWFRSDASISPIRFHRDAHEGKSYNSESWLDWSEDLSQAKVKIEKDGKPVKDTVFSEEGVLRDIINALYLARILDYDQMQSSGKPFEVMMTPYRDILKLRVRFVGKEEVSAGKAGKFKALKLALAITPKDTDNSGSGFKIGASENGTYENGEKIFLWVSDDQNHIPVYFSAPASIGSIKGKLSQYKGLKYELSSKIANE